MTLAVTQLGVGQPLVILHGWGMNAAVWSGFTEQLAADFALSLIELPGHGDSPYQNEITLADWAQACLAVAPCQAIWLGWSLGGQIALQAALEQPQRVSAVIAMNSTPRFVQAQDWPHAMDTQTLLQFRMTLQQGHRKTLERFLGLQVRGSEQARETLRSLKQRLQEKPDPSPQALDSGLQLLQDVDLRQKLDQLNCPTAWIYGERDTLVPASSAVLLKQLLPQAETSTIRGAGHAPFLSHQAQVSARINSLLEEFDAA